MSKRTQSLLIFMVLLLPSVYFVWPNRDMPEFGYLHDDGIQYLTAQSLAQGTGYRIQSLPENPAQTKYPPLFPLYLSMVWKISPNFPANLRLASLFCWGALVVMLALSWKLYEQSGLPAWHVYALGALLAINPYLILFGVTPFSEIFYTCFVLSSLLLTNKKRMWWMILAGLMASCAYLSRTAGIGLLVAIPLWLLWGKRFREAGVFIAAMLPGIVGWGLWSRSVMNHSGDLTVIYYVDYIRYEFMNVGLDNFAVVVWKNLDEALYGIGGLILPKVVGISVVKILTQVLAVAAISGIVRMVRKGMMVPYAIFGLISVLILVVWHFPPNERFMLPLLPLIAAGFVTEMQQLGMNIRSAFGHKDRSQRIAAGVFGGFVGLLLAGALALQLFVTFSFLPGSVEQKRAKLQDMKQAYTWMAANLPPDAQILSYDDPLTFLYTGHRGNSLALMPRLWYAEDYDKMTAAYANIAGYCRSRGLSYVYFTSDDLSREGMRDEDREKVAGMVKANRELLPLYQAGMVTIYKIAPQ